MDEDDREGEDGAARAFAQLGREVSLLRAAVEGLTAARETIDIPDYEPTLERTEKILVALVHQIDGLAKKPAMTLTPETMGQRLNASVADATRELQHQVQSAKSAMAGAAHDLQNMVASARRGDEQNMWLIWAGMGGLVFGLFLYALMGGPIARLAPASWQWPERVAARVLDEPSIFDAGQHLMRTANADGWRAIVAGANLVKDNSEAIDRCQQQAAKAKKAVRCTIDVKVTE
ncbi:DUF6118 family protein [Rhizorhabdus dicambivorans]|uniref:Uncharacterized protein n=1 Tax=Rhizorhabdus dicambivorans TaxID=1850238 RepID=A0A2A4FQ42_9SPHN|nr:DUF6118 family protein [Rhizorhabdus dicambivorans]ATE67999.1 hypothetical protein CMV14_26125 [Rhizorhabdus dicambivorans]ATE68024.1 hypothetical protein CMV14_26275 [Rhizorhabdus dicambivorans]PCE39834.1 hypothetical protein COO09_23335 [Rhizorhabdus dicambivorans]